MRLLSGGGNPNAKPPPAPLREAAADAAGSGGQPRAAAAAEKVQAPDRPRKPSEVKPPDPKPEYSLEPSNERKPKKPDVSTTLVTRPTKDPKAEAKARAETQAREAGSRRGQAGGGPAAQRAAAFGNAASSLRTSLSAQHDHRADRPGRRRRALCQFSAGREERLRSNAWIVPDGVTDENATAEASVTIARDGTVVSARASRAPPATPRVDRSVQVTLDRVKWAAPLPDDAKENQRTVTINFNVRAKRLLG